VTSAAGTEWPCESVRLKLVAGSRNQAQSYALRVYQKGVSKLSAPVIRRLAHVEYQGG
jgi:hypothetical protein